MVMSSWFGNALDAVQQEDDGLTEEERRQREAAAQPQGPVPVYQPNAAPQEFGPSVPFDPSKAAAYVDQNGAPVQFGPRDPTPLAAMQAMGDVPYAAGKDYVPPAAQAFLNSYGGGFANSVLPAITGAVGSVAERIAPPDIPFGLPSFGPGMQNQSQQTGLGDAALQGYQTDIPYVSPFMRDVVQPVAEDVGGVLGNSLNVAGAGLPNYLLGQLGTNAEDVGRFAGSGITPVTAGDFALNAALAGGPVEAFTGLPIDDTIRAGLTGARGAFDNALRFASPEPTLLPGLSAGIPPGGLPWDVGKFGPEPSLPDAWQMRDPAIGQNVPLNGPISANPKLDPYDTGELFGYNPAEPNFGALPSRFDTAPADVQAEIRAAQIAADEDAAMVRGMGQVAPPAKPVAPLGGQPAFGTGSRGAMPGDTAFADAVEANKAYSAEDMLRASGVTPPPTATPTPMTADEIGQAWSNSRALEVAPVDANALHQAVVDAAPGDMVTVYHTVDREVADQIRQNGFNPGSALTTDPETARMLGANRHGPDAEVLRFDVPRSSLDQESWYFTNNERLYPTAPAGGGSTPPNETLIRPVGDEAWLNEQVTYNGPGPANGMTASRREWIEAQQHGNELYGAADDAVGSSGFDWQNYSAPTGGGSTPVPPPAEAASSVSPPPASTTGGNGGSGLPPTPPPTPPAAALPPANNGPMSGVSPTSVAVPPQALTGQTQTLTTGATQNMNTLYRGTGAPPPPPPNGTNMAAASNGAVPPNNAVVQAAAAGGFNPQVQNALDKWLQYNVTLIDGYTPNQVGRLYAAADAVFSGKPQDSYVSKLTERLNALEQRLDLAKANPKDRAAAIKSGMEQDALRHFQGDKAKAQAALNEVAANNKRAAMIEKDVKLYSELSGRLRNSVLSDIGVFGYQVLASLRHGGLPEALGVINHIGAAAHIPGFVNLAALSGENRTAALLNMGLNLRPDGATQMRGVGTIARYVPGLNVLDKYAVTPAIDALEKAQFSGVMGLLKQLDAEGRLLIAKGTGQNLSDPATTQRIMRAVNNDNSSALGALTPGRKVLEREVLLSPSITRSMTGRLTDMAKITTGNYTDRVIAATSLLSYALFAAGAGKVLNDMIGISGYDPLQGRITLPTKDSDGRHHVISVMPGNMLEKTIMRSYEALKEGNPEDLLKIWGQAGVSRLNIIPSDILRGGGVGYGDRGKFYWGDMPTEQRIEGAIPAPISVKNSVLEGKTDPVTIGLSAFGVNEFPQSGSAQLKDLRDAVVNDPRVPEAIRGTEYKNLGPDGKAAVDEVVKKDNPADYADATKAQKEESNPVFQKHREATEKINQTVDQRSTQLYNLLREGKITGEQLRQGREIINSSAKAQREAARNDPEYKKAVSELEKNEVSKALDAYYKIWDNTPKLPNGKPDYDKIEANQAKFLAFADQKDPETAKLLRFEVSTGAAKTNPLDRLYELARPMLEKYGNIKDDYARSQAQMNNPREDAFLAMLGYGKTQTQEAAQILQQLRAALPSANAPVSAAAGNVQRSAVPAPPPAPAPQPMAAPLPVPTGTPRTLPPVAPDEFKSAAASPQQRQNFINAMAGPANDYSAVTKIPPAVFAAMGASESNWGRAPSVFGIKGVGSAGGANLQTHEIIGGKRVDMPDQFAAYNNLDDAFKHFIDLTSHGRYAPAWQQLQETGDWQGFLRGITAAGYATAKDWPDSIISLTNHIEKTYPQFGGRR